MPGQGMTARKAVVNFDISALEVEGGHLEGGTGTITEVWPMWDQTQTN